MKATFRDLATGKEYASLDAMCDALGLPPADPNFNLPLGLAIDSLENARDRLDDAVRDLAADGDIEGSWHARRLAEGVRVLLAKSKARRGG